MWKGPDLIYCELAITFTVEVEGTDPEAFDLTVEDASNEDRQKGIIQTKYRG